MPPSAHRLALVAAALFSAACDRGAVDAPLAPAGQAADAQASPLPEASPDEASLSAPSAAASGEPLSAPPPPASSAPRPAEADDGWPEPGPGEKLRLTWVVYSTPEPAEPRSQGPLWPTELVVRVGAKARRIPVGLGVGSLFQTDQHVCAPPGEEPNRVRASGEVAKISFYLGGGNGYLVRRSHGWLEIVSFLETDGICMDDHGTEVACPRPERVVTRVRAPRPLPVAERIVMVEGRGKEHDLECGI